jgi:hypothetical protein
MDQSEVATMWLLAGMLAIAVFILGSAGVIWFQSEKVITAQDQWKSDWDKIEENLRK